MKLGFRFDADEDRLVLLAEGGDTAHAFWLTRRQCLALLILVRRTLQSLPPDARPVPRGDFGDGVRRSPDKPASGDGDGDGDSPRLTGAPQSEPPPPVAVRLRSRRLPDGLRLVLATDGQRGLRLELKSAELVVLADSLMRAARRAQWDFDAALARLEKKQDAHRVLH